MKIKKICPKCNGFGWWPIGGLSPIGPMDAQEWSGRTIKCPWCKNGFVNKGERYKALEDAQKLEEKKKK